MRRIVTAAQGGLTGVTCLGPLSQPQALRAGHQRCAGDATQASRFLRDGRVGDFDSERWQRRPPLFDLIDARFDDAQFRVDLFVDDGEQRSHSVADITARISAGGALAVGMRDRAAQIFCQMCSAGREVAHKAALLGSALTKSAFANSFLSGSHCAFRLRLCTRALGLAGVLRGGQHLGEQTMGKLVCRFFFVQRLVQALEPLL